MFVFVVSGTLGWDGHRPRLGIVAPSVHPTRLSGFPHRRVIIFVHVGQAVSFTTIGKVHGTTLLVPDPNVTVRIVHGEIESIAPLARCEMVGIKFLRDSVPTSANIVPVVQPQTVTDTHTLAVKIWYGANARRIIYFLSGSHETLAHRKGVRLFLTIDQSRLIRDSLQQTVAKRCQQRVVAGCQPVQRLVQPREKCRQNQAIRRIMPGQTTHAVSNNDQVRCQRLRSS